MEYTFSNDYSCILCIPYKLQTLIMELQNIYIWSVISDICILKMLLCTPKFIIKIHAFLCQRVTSILNKKRWLAEVEINCGVCLCRSNINSQVDIVVKEYKTQQKLFKWHICAPMTSCSNPSKQEDARPLNLQSAYLSTKNDICSGRPWAIVDDLFHGSQRRADVGMHALCRQHA